jgi:hypothetical protein
VGQARSSQSAASQQSTDGGRLVHHHILLAGHANFVGHKWLTVCIGYQFRAQATRLIGFLYCSSSIAGRGLNPIKIVGCSSCQPVVLLANGGVGQSHFRTSISTLAWRSALPIAEDRTVSEIERSHRGTDREYCRRREHIAAPTGNTAGVRHIRQIEGPPRYHANSSIGAPDPTSTTRHGRARPSHLVWCVPLQMGGSVAGHDDRA